jgi:tetratricopeptide (TPR) repeat protein
MALLRTQRIAVIVAVLALGAVKLMAAQETAAPSEASFKQVIPFGAMLYYEEARVLLKAGQRAEATAKLRRALQEFPDFLQARIDLAQELLSRKALDEALEIIEGARRIYDRDPRVYRLFGLIMLEQGKPKMAEFAFRQAIERGPNYAPNYQAHGVALTDLALSDETPAVARANWLTQAEQQLRKSLELSDGKLAFSHLHLARVYETRGEKLKAAAELENFLLKNPRAANEKNVRAAIAKLRQ